jgi:hypothetical protein
VQEVLLSTAAARPVADRRKWLVSVTGPIRELIRLTKLPPARGASPRCKAFLEAARMSREMGRL